MVGWFFTKHNVIWVSLCSIAEIQVFKNMKVYHWVSSSRRFERSSALQMKLLQSFKNNENCPAHITESYPNRREYSSDMSWTWFELTVPFDQWEFSTSRSILWPEYQWEENKWIPQKCDVRLWTGFMWFRTGTSGELLQTQKRIFMFHQMSGVS